MEKNDCDNSYYISYKVKEDTYDKKKGIVFNFYEIVEKIIELDIDKCKLNVNSKCLKAFLDFCIKIKDGIDHYNN